MSDCPYVYDPNGIGLYRYDPCNCGRPYPCLFGQPIEVVLPYLIGGLILGLIPFIALKIHLWKATRGMRETH